MLVTNRRIDRMLNRNPGLVAASTLLHV